MNEFKSILLRHFPASMYAFLLQEQARILLAEGQKITIERIIYRIIREKIERKGEKEA